jgi:hypothetical protein
MRMGVEMHTMGMPEFILFCIFGVAVTEALCWLVRKL